MSSILKDTATITLLGMVLLTNAAILIIPACVEGYGASVGHTVCKVAMLVQIPGYIALIILCALRLLTNESMQNITAGKSNTYHARFQNTMMAVHVLLFVSLLCGTFLIQRQAKTLANANDNPIELPSFRTEVPNRPGLLRYFSI